MAKKNGKKKNSDHLSNGLLNGEPLPQHILWMVTFVTSVHGLAGSKQVMEVNEIASRSAELADTAVGLFEKFMREGKSVN